MVRYYEIEPEKLRRFDNSIKTQAEPDVCRECGTQLRDGDLIYFDGGKTFTFTVGPTLRKRYIKRQNGSIEEHAKPTCKEAQERETRELKDYARNFKIVGNPSDMFRQ